MEFRVSWHKERRLFEPWTFIRSLTVFVNLSSWHNRNSDNLMQLREKVLTRSLAAVLKFRGYIKLIFKDKRIKIWGVARIFSWGNSLATESLSGEGLQPPGWLRSLKLFNESKYRKMNPFSKISTLFLPFYLRKIWKIWTYFTKISKSFRKIILKI